MHRQSPIPLGHPASSVAVGVQQPVPITAVGVQQPVPIIRASTNPYSQWHHHQAPAPVQRRPDSLAGLCHGLGCSIL